MSTPPGWYDDGHGQQRWWDGSQWTHHTQAHHPQPSPGAPAPQSDNLFGKLGSSVKKAVEGRKVARAEAARQQEEMRLRAGKLLTSGVFGTATIEIFENGYVRVADSSDPVPVRAIKNSPPYERLISIKFTSPSDTGSTIESHMLEGTAIQAAATLLKGGNSLMKASLPSLALTGATHIVRSRSGKSTLSIATDSKIHLLTNMADNGFGIATVQREQEEVGRTLERIGNSIIDHSPSSLLSAPSLPQIEASAHRSGHTIPPEQSTDSPSLSDRLRELASLHADGILDDAEFTAAKAKLLGGL